MFLWAVLAHLHPAKTHSETPSKYLKYENELNVNGIKFPVTRDQINIFESKNEISVNLFGY